jgi:cation diffusion facilitator family transporter
LYRMESAYKIRVLELSLIAITSVIIVELYLGIIVSSLAIISDGLHATLDAITSAVILLATRASLKPPDEEHMYGHEKFESIGGLIGGIALIGVALLIIYEAIIKIINNETVNTTLEYLGFIAVGYTFCVDIFRVGTLIRGRKSSSPTLRVGFYHAAADMSSTLIAFLGFALATLGYHYGDSLASIVLGIMLSYLSIRLVRSTGYELSDTASREVVARVRKTVLDTKGIERLKELKIRRAGDKTFIRVTIQVPNYMDFDESHRSASRVEENVKKALKGDTDILVHVEPSPGIPTEKVVENIATAIPGVKNVHGVNISCTEGRVYVTLHSRVDPRMSVQEAHDIAEKIENSIIGSIRDIENVSVHVEPFKTRKPKGIEVNEQEIREILYEAAEERKEAVRIKGIRTYVIGDKRYLNVDCIFTKQISIEEAHQIASQIEDKIREHFEETIVTVHMEPQPEPHERSPFGH